MKFRIITSLILLVVLAMAWVIYEQNQPQQPTDSGDGIVLH